MQPSFYGFTAPNVRIVLILSSIVRWWRYILVSFEAFEWQCHWRSWKLIIIASRLAECTKLCYSQSQPKSFMFYFYTRIVWDFWHGKILYSLLVMRSGTIWFPVRSCTYQSRLCFVNSLLYDDMWCLAVNFMKINKQAWSIWCFLSWFTMIYDYNNVTKLMYFDW